MPIRRWFVPMREVFGGVLLVLLVAAGVGCGEEPPPVPTKVPQVEVKEESQGSVVAGVIVRDAGTKADIRKTASVSIPAESADSLGLTVTKSRYRLDVILDGKSIKTFPVALGHEPVGDKVRQGDGRTPEGDYVLVPHYPSPNFGGCFYVCYPNESDAKRGLEEGLIGEGEYRRITQSLSGGRKPPYQTELGGLILLHGTKNRSAPFLTTTNWTLGCIAMENDDLLELLEVFSSSDRPVLKILP